MRNGLESRNIGAEKEKPDLTILVPHDASADDLWNNYLDIYEQILLNTEIPAQPKVERKKKKKNEEDDEVPDDGKEQIFRKLLTVEQDVFASAAAEQIAFKILEELKGEARIEVLKVLVPRAVIDMNRVKEKAIWKTFSHEENPGLVNKLRQIYESLSRSIQQRIDGTGMLLDLHTMSPTHPWEKVTLSPTNIPEFIESWRHNPEKIRKNDILSKRRTEQGESVPIGDPELILAVKNAFEENHIPHGMSETYELNKDHLGTRWSGMVRSFLSLDLTKDNGSKEKASDKNFDVSNLTFDPHKLMKITGPIAQAIAHVIKERLRRTKTVVQ